MKLYTFQLFLPRFLSIFIGDLLWVYSALSSSFVNRVSEVERAPTHELIVVLDSISTCIEDILFNQCNGKLEGLSPWRFISSIEIKTLNAFNFIRI